MRIEWDIKYFLYEQQITQVRVFLNTTTATNWRKIQLPLETWDDISTIVYKSLQSIWKITEPHWTIEHKSEQIGLCAEEIFVLVNGKFNYIYSCVQFQCWTSEYVVVNFNHSNPMMWNFFFLSFSLSFLSSCLTYSFDSYELAIHRHQHRRWLILIFRD